MPATFVRTDMQAAMETFAQVKEGKAVHMEVVAAPGTTGESRIGCNRKEDDEPDGKDYFNCPVRWRHLEGEPHSRDVHQNNQP